MHSVCLWMSELSSAEYVKIAFKSKEKLEKFAFVLHVVHKSQDLVHVVVFQRITEKCTKIYNARAEPLFCLVTLSLPSSSWFRSTGSFSNHDGDGNRIRATKTLDLFFVQFSILNVIIISTRNSNQTVTWKI